MAPVGLLTAQLGPLAKMKVEIAWGANLLFDASNWTWTDVTTDLRQANGQKISITPMGRSDEYGQAQPAACSFVVDNPAATAPYSKGPQSVNYPNVRRNTPVRVSVTLNNGGTWFTRFFGYIVTFKPSDDTSAADGWVTVKAYGKLRQLTQGKNPLRSTLFRAYLKSSVQPLAYIPFEDLANSTQVASGLPNGTPGTMNPNNAAGFQPFQFAQVSTCPGAAALPQMSMPAGTAAQATFPVTAGPDSFWSVDFTAFVSAQTLPAAGACQVGDVLLSSGGTWTDAAFLFNNNTGSLQFIGTRPNLTQDMLAEYDPGSLFDGKWHHYRLTATQSGGNVIFTIECDGVQVVTNTIAGTLKHITTGIAYAQNTVPYSYGHYAVFGQTTSTFYPASTGYLNETATDRLTRLFNEEGGFGMPLALTGSSTMRMGPQSVDTFVNLIRECESTDLGLLLNGLTQGMSYVARSSRYNLAPALTLNAAAAQLDPPFEPEDDDQRNRNLWQVQRKNGSTAIVSDKTGTLGTDAIGVYDATATVNTATDIPLDDIGAWLVHLGTVDEPYRYPKLGLDFSAIPSQAGNWLATPIGGRIDVTNLRSVSTRHPPGLLSLVLEGYTETLSPYEWKVTANCSPYVPYVVAATGAWPLELAGQTLAANLNPGATTLSLATAAGYPNLFSTTARFPADFPVDLEVAGWPVHVTAATGSTSPQTLTIDPAPNTSAIPAGTPVSLLRPAVLAL